MWYVCFHAIAVLQREIPRTDINTQSSVTERASELLYERGWLGLSENRPDLSLHITSSTHTCVFTSQWLQAPGLAPLHIKCHRLKWAGQTNRRDWEEGNEETEGGEWEFRIEKDKDGKDVGEGAVAWGSTGKIFEKLFLNPVVGIRRRRSCLCKHHPSRVGELVSLHFCVLKQKGKMVRVRSQGGVLRRGLRFSGNRGLQGQRAAAAYSWDCRFKFDSHWGTVKHKSCFQSEKPILTSYASTTKYGNIKVKKSLKIY